MGIFDSLHIGKSGLNAAQIQLSVTGQNITNANSEYYTRQRVIQSAATPLHDVVPGDIGMGVRLETITRIHNEFTFNKLKTSQSALTYTEYKSDVLQEVTNYFPTLQDADIFNDLKNYFESWNDFASNSDEAAQKLNLLRSSETLINNMNTAANNVDAIIRRVNEELALTVDEINLMIKQIAEINMEIQRAEANGISRANDLRDKRDELELNLSRIVNINTYKEDMTASSRYGDDVTVTDQGRKYTLSINGVTLIDGPNYHELEFNDDEMQYGFGKIYYKIDRDRKIDISSKITGGKAGAMLDLRGRHVNDNGELTDGILTLFKDELDTFAKTFIIATNNVYGQAAQESLDSDFLSEARDNMTLQNFSKDINSGDFTVKIYNKNGDLIAQKSINVNPSTTFNDTRQGNSIVDDFNANTDDNNDNNLNNDVNDYFEAVFKYDPQYRKGHLQFNPKFAEGEYFIAIDDGGTNVSGVLGMSKFFEGTNANNINIAKEIREDSSRIVGGKTPVLGDNSMANEMVNLQNKNLNFITKFSDTQSATIVGYYRYFATDMAATAEEVNTLNVTNNALYNNIYSIFQSESGVNMDEELTNLIQFQASYGAAAKIITTVDEMLDTLLGLKR